MSYHAQHALIITISINACHAQVGTTCTIVDACSYAQLATSATVSHQYARNAHRGVCPALATHHARLALTPTVFPTANSLPPQHAHHANPHANTVINQLR